LHYSIIHLPNKYQMEKKDNGIIRPETLVLFSPSSSLPHDAKPITKTPLPSPIDGFLLYNVLSPSECEHYIKQTEQIGYEKLTGYRQEYRDNQRIALKCEELSELIFARVKEFIPTEVNISPNDEMRMSKEMGTAGLWKLHSMNELWRFCRYYPGGLFKRHYDGYFERDIHERSFYTFMIYLNGGFEGGQTNFLAHGPSDIRKMTEEGKTIISQVEPEAGLALVFLHPFIHEGATLETGVKYIMRSEFMYKRELASTDMDEREQEALKLYRKAGEIESENPMEAMELYRKAFKMSKKLADAYNNM